MTVNAEDPAFGPDQIHEFVPTFKEASQSTVLQGWQPLKSILSSDPTTLLHAKNIAEQATFISSSLLVGKDDGPNIQISSFEDNLVLSNRDLSYQIYKTFTYESPLITFVQ